MGFEIALLTILTLCLIISAGIVVVLVTLVRKWDQLRKILNYRKSNSPEKRNDSNKFDKLPKEYQDAVNHIVDVSLGDEFPDMNDAFRSWQAVIFDAGAMDEEGHWPDFKLLELEALAFRGGWLGRDQERICLGDSLERDLRQVR